MKRIIAAALAVCLALCAALAEGTGQGIEVQWDGRTLWLDFDNTAEFSSVMEGRAQASFYTYGGSNTVLYELTIAFPEDVRPGDVIDMDYALAHDPDCSVVAIFTRDAQVAYYYAGVVDGKAYPGNSSFAITFDGVTRAAEGTTYTGRLKASLAGMDTNAPEDMKRLEIEDAPFTFTMPDANRQSSVPDPGDGYNPFETEDPFAPTPTPEIEDTYDATPTPAPTPDTARV